MNLCIWDGMISSAFIFWKQFLSMHYGKIFTTLLFLIQEWLSILLFF